LAEKEENDRKAKMLAEIEAKKQLLNKASAQDTTKKSSTAGKTTTSVPKIVDSDYRDGVTEETVTESNRTIYRTVVKKDGAATNYQKIVYNWGGVFFFRNDNNITQTTFDQDIKQAKAAFPK